MKRTFKCQSPSCSCSLSLSLVLVPELSCLKELTILIYISKKKKNSVFHIHTAICISMKFRCRPAFVCYVYMDVPFSVAIGRDRMRFSWGECGGLAGCFSSSLLSPPQGRLQKFSSGRNIHAVHSSPSASSCLLLTSP